MLAGIPKFVRTFTEFLSYLLGLGELGIEFCLRGLMLSIESVNRTLAFQYLRVQFLVRLNKSAVCEVCGAYLQLTYYRCHFQAHSIDALLQRFFFSN